MSFDSALSSLDPLILRYCKQVYHHLSLDGRIQQLSKPTLPAEVQKMKALFSLDPQELENTVKRFIQKPHPPNGKKNIGNFVQMLVVAIKECTPSFDDLYEDAFTRDESLKRTRDDYFSYGESMAHQANKRRKPEFPFNTQYPSPSTFSMNSQYPSSSSFSYDTTASINTTRSAPPTTTYNLFSSSSTVYKPFVTSPTELNPQEVMERGNVKQEITKHESMVQDRHHKGGIEQDKYQKESTKEREDNDDSEDEEDEEDTTQNKKFELPFIKGLDSITITSPPSSSKSFDKVPWFITYEIARFVHTCGVSWDDLTFQTLQTFFQAANELKPRLHEAMMEWNQERRNENVNGLSYTLMEKSAPQVWSFFNQVKEADLETKERGDIRYSIALRAKISTKPPVMLLQPPTLSSSNRFFRKFGSDRFLEMKYVKSTHSNMFAKQQEYYLKPFVLMQRTYRFLFIKDLTVIFFATEGPGLEPVSIKQVVDWHMPILENWGMEINKYASRMSLGYSNSIPTIVFKPQQIEYIDDVYAESKEKDKVNSCMTDGCGIISCSAMKKVMGCQATDELPCAIQGRIAGAKGIWIIDPDLDFNSGDYIKIRTSQNKFKTGMPQEDLEEDPLHYTFDLVKNAGCTYPSNLNTQFIQALAAGGVPTQIFQSLLKEYIHRIRSMITINRNVKVLRDWVSKTGKVMLERWEKECDVKKDFWKSRTLDEEFDYDDDDPFSTNNTSFSSWTGILSNSVQAKDNKYSGQPGSPYEVVVRLLDSGFDLTNSYVANRITYIFREIMRSITTKYKIEVEQSCTVTCIPDPTGTLQAGQVFLQLSKRKKDENTGIRSGLITGDVIVTRNPCGLKSDIQKVEAVDNNALRMYTDVIVFPITGSRSLASQLSGGDYDGDLVFCCWDERIVKPFTSSPPSDDLKRVSKAFIKDKGTIGSKISHCQENAEQIIQKCFMSVNIPDGTLGAYENWRTVLAEKTSLDNEEVLYLAQMCSKLVDAPKQGLRLKTEVKMKDKKLYSAIPYPAWFMDKRNKQRPKGKAEYREVNDVYTIQNAPCETTMDYLYKTLLEETEGFTRYSKSIFNEEDLAHSDVDLMTPWMKANELSAQFGDPNLKEDLKLIEKKVMTNFQQYCKQISQLLLENQRFADAMHNPQSYRDDKLVIPSVSASDNLKFDSQHELEAYFAKDFLTLPEGLKSDTMLCDVEANGGNMIRTISASYAYKMSVSTRKHSKYCYIVAFDLIRRIKSDACAKRIKSGAYAETVSANIYKAMSVDRNWVSQLKELQAPDEGEMKMPRIGDHLAAGTT